MRVGAIPAGLIEWLMLRANQIPVPLVESFSAMMNAKAILAANELGLFEALDGGPLAPEEIAARIGASERGVRDLSDALVASGYLASEGGRITLTDLSRKWLARSSPWFIGNMLEHVNDLWAVWLNLEEAVRRGGPPAADYQDWLGDERYGRILARHIMGLRDLVKTTAPEILRAIKLPPGDGPLLDVGGGHGGYSMAFCEKYPSLTANVFDLEATVAIGRKIVEEEGMAGRVKFQVGDFLKDDFGRGYRAALYFNIAHNYSDEENREVIAKIYGALEKGGLLAIWDMFKGGPKARDAQPALMALHMLVASGGTSYPVEAVYGWLRDAGFERLSRRRTRTAPGLSIITARKP